MSRTQALRWPARLIIGLIGSYRLVLSPWLPPACRFVPTCSDYAAEVVRRHGISRGLPKACGRLLRCHPFNRGGVDLPE